MYYKTFHFSHSDVFKPVLLSARSECSFGISFVSSFFRSLVTKTRVCKFQARMSVNKTYLIIILYIKQSSNTTFSICIYLQMIYWATSFGHLLTIIQALT